MAGVHMLIGCGETLITALVVVAVSRARPELLVEGNPSLPVRSIGETLTFGLLIALGIALFISPLASTWPDGLEKVSIDQGFDDTATDHALGDTPLADYGVEVPSAPIVVSARALSSASPITTRRPATPFCACARPARRAPGTTQAIKT